MPGLNISSCIVMLFVSMFFYCTDSFASTLSAGVAKINITDTSVPANDSLYVKALVLDDGSRKIVLITIDAVAIAEIGRIKNDYLFNVRSALQKELKISPLNVLINASHCHGLVCMDIEQRTIEAVKIAFGHMVPVMIGSGTGYEERIMENRRMALKNGREADSRHAYSLPPDEEVIAMGPVDPEIGIVRIDKKDGTTLAVVYNFGIHPIQSVPNKKNTADITGFSSRVIEDCFKNAMAFFIQGCAGDINPVMYKDVHSPRDAEQLGNILGLSTIRGIANIKADRKSTMNIIQDMIELPKADLKPHIESLQNERDGLIRELKGTSLNFKTFYLLMNKYNFSSQFPSGYSHRYIRDSIMGEKDLILLDNENRKNMESYLRNIYIMEQLSRNQINLDLLKKHNDDNIASGSTTITVEITGIRIGNFYLISFPGELSSQIGLNIKKNSPHDLTFIAGVSNGYIYYAPTEEQLKNRGYAQEDSDCIVGPGWQKIFEDKASEILKKL